MCGWEDFPGWSEYEQYSGTPLRRQYTEMRREQNDLVGIARRWEVALIANHAVSAFDAYFTARRRALALENKEPGSIILNYADAKNMPWEGSMLRDYVKQVDEDNDDLYLGKAFFAVGPLRIMPQYFIIQRHRQAVTEVEHKV